MSNTVIVLESLPTRELPKCQPNLMPFHISYNGPALVSTFMKVKPAKEEVPGAPPEKKDPEAVVEDAKQEDPSTFTEEKMAVDTATTSTDDTTPPQDTPASPEHKLSTTRSVSAFRGRTIQGLKVDVPQGYRGLVFQAPPAASTSTTPPKPKKPTASKTKKQSEQVPIEDDDDLAPGPSTRRRGRLTRSAAPKKTVVVVEDVEEEPVAPALIDVDAEMAVDGGAAQRAEGESEGDGVLDALQRRLKPVAEFSSFTIWHPDNPVIENQDEYYRSVHEWTTLAAELHHGDDE